MTNVPSPAPLLDITNLSKRFGGLVATDGLDLDVMRGEIHAVIGPNGAGKTTLIGQLAGELAPDEGRIMFDGHDITNLPPIGGRNSAWRDRFRSPAFS